jgi:hypothetical protein
MGYLVSHDFNLLIQQKEFNQFTTNDLTISPKAEAWAEREISSKLSQRYDVGEEFQPTTSWSFASTYNAAALVEINFPAYDATKTYILNSLVIQAGVGYINITPVTIAEAFNIAKWTTIGNQYDLYYAVTPKPLFNYKKYYKVGDQVFWKNATYTCLIETLIPSHVNQLQYASQVDIPLYNTFPDDPINGLSHWGAGTTYTVSAGTPLSNATYWTLGDNRDAQCVNYACILAIYRMTPRVSVNNVPANRLKLFEEALQWLEDVSHGNINVDIPVLQPDQGLSIISGGQVKRINQW